MVDIKRQEEAFEKLNTTVKENILSDYFKVYDGTHSTPTYVEEGIPFFSVESIHTKLYNVSKFVTEEVYEKEIKRVKIEKNDIFLTRIGDVGTPRLVEFNEKVSFYVSLALLKPKSTNIVSKYYLHNITSEKFQSQIWAKMLHVAFPKKINLSDIGKLPIHTHNHQVEVANLLSSLDELIQKQEEYIEELKVQKKAYSQKIFSQKLRFKGFNDKWEEKKVKEMFEVTRGNVLSKEDTIDNGSYPVYSSQTSRKGLMGYYNEYLFEDAITWTTDGANAGDVNMRYGKFYCTNVCGVLKSDKGYANQFIAENLNTITHKHVSYIGNPKLMNNVMSEIVLKVPGVEEQKKISELLNTLNNHIELQENKLEQLKLKKKYYLNKIFA